MIVKFAYQGTNMISMNVEEARLIAWTMRLAFVPLDKQKEVYELIEKLEFLIHQEYEK